MTQIWRKRNFFRLQRLGLVQNSNERIAKKKSEKPQFLGILGQDGQFWTVFFTKMGKTRFFSKKRLGHVYRAYKP